MPTHEDGRPHRARQDAAASREANTKVAQTALMTARMRTLIPGLPPIVSRIYDIAAARWAAAGNSPAEIPEPEKNIPSHEARTMITDRLIAEAGNTQVLDLGAGLMHRGAVTAEESEVNYVEVDVPEMARLKKAVLGQLQPEFSNLHIEAGNILDGDALMKIVRSRLTPGQPTTIVMEGVLHYLTIPRPGHETRPNQRAMLAENLKRVFEYTSGGRIITDMPVDRPGESAKQSAVAKRTSEITDVDIRGNRFTTNEEAEQFFADLGLQVTQRVPFNSVVDELRSPTPLGVSTDEVRTENAPWFMWVLEPAAA